MALALPHYHSFVCVRILSKLSKGGLTGNKPTHVSKYHRAAINRRIINLVWGELGESETNNFKRHKHS